MKIGIIGGGNMGGALYKILSAEFGADAIYICDRNADKLSALGAVHYTADPNEIVDQVEVLILAVKPQSFSELCTQVNKDLSSKLIISVMAGVDLQRLEDGTKSKRIVRAMPNLGVQVSKGVVGWIASIETTEQDKKYVRTMFSATGEEIELNSEEMINNITALHNPSYYFYICELIQSKAEELGISPEQARKIAEATFIGSATVFESDDRNAKEWREAVSSKGGTTEATFKYLQENKFDEIFKQGIGKGKERAEEL